MATWKKILSTFAKNHSKMILLFILVTISLISFSILANVVSSKESLGLDKPILMFVHSFASPFFNTFFTTVTNLGESLYILIVAAILATYFAYKRAYQKAAVLLLSMGGIVVANTVLKFIFQRDRPTLWEHLVSETNFSFPSGHAMISIGFAMALVAIFWNTKYRVITIVLAAIGTLLVGLSRLYLGVHYPSDILAGWCVSVAWVSLVLAGVKCFYGRITAKAS